MTFDQFTHLLAVLAWPAVAVIAGTAWVHGCRLLADTWLNNQKAVARQQFAAEERHRLTINKLADAKRSKMEQTCERALLAVLSAIGGFPAKQGEAPGRSLVREIREMYAEIERPTPAPVPAPTSTNPTEPAQSATTAQVAEFVADDIFAEYIGTDEDVQGDLGVLDEELQ